jgi:3-oxoacyl-[acyl-carrier-protein] synthase-3
MTSRILGLGIALPEQRLTNADLETRMETSDDWIVERTGIRERRVAAEGEWTSTLATEAGAQAIKRSGITTEDIDLVIVATLTPDQPMPSTAAYVQDNLGIRAGAFDLGAACSGFTYSLVVASSMIATGGIRNALVIGAEVLTRVVDPHDRGTAILFGDGAGAAVVGPAPEGEGILAWDIGCDGSLASILDIPAGGSRIPASAESVANKLHFAKMEGREVFRRAVRVVIDSASTTLEHAGITADQVDLFVPHQANIRIIEAVNQRLGIPMERTVVNVDRYGNTSAASIPIALAEAEHAGRIKPGDLVLLSGFGAGMTWATTLIRWSGKS